MVDEIGQHFVYESDGKPTREGVCDRVESRMGKWRNVTTGEVAATESVRMRLRPATGRPFWTAWFPKRKAR